MRHVPTISEPRLLTADDVDALCARLADICTDSPVVLLYLHGAYARCEQTALSDLDVAVLFATTTETSLTEEAGKFERTVEEETGRDDVDLLVLNNAGSIVKGRVVRAGRLVFARGESERVAFEAAAIRESVDFDYFARSYNRTLFRRLREEAHVG